MSHFIPSHLKKYIVPQNYKKYSPEDQALWRYMMKGIHHNLALYGQKGGLEGLKKSGIQWDKIPKIFDIDKKLQKFGWRAVCISGFIPPRAFMEFQLHKILPIASEIRTIHHVFYTPAPDIVHEAVGHIPFLTNPAFSEFLKKYAQTVLKAIVSQEDIEKYKAVRDLSDLKENPKSTKIQIQKQEQKLKTIIKNITYTSESSYLSRLIWWTSEYGLMGSLKNPKIYGAGLISSIGESLQIQKVKKIPLSAHCLNYPFDITSFQPQLFVAKDFEHLLDVLTTVSKKLAFYRGGVYGLNQAVRSRTLNTAVLDSGLMISGVLENTINTKRGRPVFLKFSGPCQLSFEYKQLKGHGRNYHSEGYSSPLRYITKMKKPFWLLNDLELRGLGLKRGCPAKMYFEGGLSLEGQLERCLRRKGRLLILTFKACLIRDGQGMTLYDPSWGPFDLAVGNRVESVFSGPADSRAYGLQDDFAPSKVPTAVWTARQKKVFAIYKKTARLKNPSLNRIKKLLQEIKSQKNNWLLALELLSCVKNKKRIKNMILGALESVEETVVQNKKVFKLGKKFYNIR